MQQPKRLSGLALKWLRAKDKTRTAFFAEVGIDKIVDAMDAETKKLLIAKLKEQHQ